MTQFRTSITVCAAVLLAASAAACSKPDEAALARGDAAFKGQMIDGVLTPVASRPVMVGNDGPQSPACTRQIMPKTGTVAVHWSPDASGPAKADLDGPALSCQTEGTWTGVIFPAFGQSLNDCDLSRRLRSAREYQGPCRWGWVETAAVKPAG